MITFEQAAEKEKIKLNKFFELAQTDTVEGYMIRQEIQRICKEYERK